MNLKIKKNIGRRKMLITVKNSRINSALISGSVLFWTGIQGVSSLSAPLIDNEPKNDFLTRLKLKIFFK